MFHWRVQAYLVGNLSLDSQLEYRGLLPGLRVNGPPIRTFTMNIGPPPKVCRVVIEGWTPETSPDSPQKEA